jgi:hypothetical protein
MARANAQSALIIDYAGLFDAVLKEILRNELP